MTRTATQVATYAKRIKDNNVDVGVGYCLRFSRMAAGAPGGVYDANTGWARARYRHTKGTPPRGSIVWWHSSTHGHVAVSAGDGYVYSTDIVQRRRVDRVPIPRIREKWGLRYVGWSWDINGVLIDHGQNDNPPVGASGGTVPKPRHRGTITINGNDYPDVAGVSVYYININRDGKNMSRHIWYCQRWLNKVLNGADIKCDGHWEPKTQAAFDRFRHDKLHLRGADATGKVGVWSLGKLNDMARSAKPVRAGK